LRYQSHASMAQAVSALRRAREGSGASLDRRARQQLTARCFRTWLELERRGELRAEGGAQTAEQLTPLADEQLASHADSEGRLSAARPNYLPPAAVTAEEPSGLLSLALGSNEADK